MERVSDTETNGKVHEVMDKLKVITASASDAEMTGKVEEPIEKLKVIRQSASDAEMTGKIDELIDKLKVMTDSASGAEMTGKAQEIIDILEVQEIASFDDAEIQSKIQEIMDILKIQNIMTILQLPYEKCLQHYRVFNELIQLPRIAAGVQTQFDAKVQKITKDIRLAQEKLEKSVFYEEFMRQMQSPELVAGIERVIGTDPHHSHLQLVLYGVGSFNPRLGYPGVEHSQMQLAFALLLREKFPWVNDIEVYDPILSPLERRVINELNCTSLHVDEQARRTVDRPTLFFTAHCPVQLHEFALEANWTPDNLSKIIILGNSFKREDTFDWALPKMRAVRNTDNVLYEIPLPETTIRKACPAVPSNSSLGTHKVISRDVFRDAFNRLSWHFFAWDVSFFNLPTAD